MKIQILFYRGWQKETIEEVGYDKFFAVAYKNFEGALINPKAWQAVGKVEGWVYEVVYANESMSGVKYSGTYEPKMHRMIDALAEGKSLEQFLETL